MMGKLLQFRDRRLLTLLVSSLVLVALRPTPIQHQVWEEARTGFRALQANENAQALAAFEAALLAEPALSPLHLTTARLALQTSDFETARYHLARAALMDQSQADLPCLRLTLTLLDPQAMDSESRDSLNGSACDLSTLAIDQARSLASEGQWEPAAELLSRLVAFQLENPTAMREISLLLAITDPLESIPTLRQASDFAGQSDTLILDLIRAIEDSRPSSNLAFTVAQVGQTFARAGLWLEASWAFQQAIELDPEYVEASAYYGLALDQIGEDGIEYLTIAKSAFPNAALPHIFLGMHWSQRGDLNRALLELEIGVGLDPENPSAWAELGSVYTQIGMVAEAREAYIQAVTLAPGEWEFWYLLAQFSTSLEIEMAEIGIPAARNMVTLGPSDPRSYDLLGYAHFLNGNLPLAERHLLRAIALQPTLASAQYHLGQLRRFQGDIVRSQAAFQLALQLDPDGPFGILARRALGLPLAE